MAPTSIPSIFGISTQGVVKSIVNTPAAPVAALDARQSHVDGNAVGGSLGVHTWLITGVQSTVSMAGSSTPLTLASTDTNTTISGSDAFKSVAGNSWNSVAYSTESFDPADEDFMLLCRVESVTGTIREKVGATSDPTANSSYNTQDYAVYQVNGTTYSRVYENGAAVTHSGQLSLAVGDLIGVRAVGGAVDYVKVSGGTVTSFHTSANAPAGLLHFRASFNRGNTSSGASRIEAAQVIRGGATSSKTIRLTGSAGEVMSGEDVDKLRTIGLNVQPGATYSYIPYIRDTSSRFQAGGSPTPLDVSHGYGGVFDQSTLMV